MGARFAGNIAELCAIARPEIGVVTNVGLAHAEHLGGPDGIVAVKGELLEALPRTGVAIVDGDDASTPRLVAARRRTGLALRECPGRRRSSHPLHARRRVARVDRRRDAVGQRHDEARVRGAHQATNALFAIAVAGWLEVPADAIAAGLAAATGSRWRLELERRADGVAVLNDVYNANPSSMAAALARARGACRLSGRRIAVLGEMRELGDHAAAAHAEVGELAGRLGIDIVVGVGAGGASITAGGGDRADTCIDVADASEALAAVLPVVQPGDTVLLKASRAVGLEVVASGLLGRESCGSRA